MDSFDQSLKHLLQLRPAELIGFGLRDPTLRVLRPVESGLPSRGRDVDGGYLIEHGGKPCVAHIEFHRRHQSATELALDVREAQIYCEVCVTTPRSSSWILASASYPQSF
jgi:hypothetical protein